MVEQIVEPRIFADSRVDQAIVSTVQGSLERKPIDLRVEEAVKSLAQDNLSEDHMDRALQGIVGQRVDERINFVMEQVAETTMAQRINELASSLATAEARASNLEQLRYSVNDLHNRLDPKLSPLSVETIAQSLRISVAMMWVVTVGVAIWLIVAFTKLVRVIAGRIRSKRAALGSAR